MAKYQLPPLKDERQFEEFVCDLFNAVENTNSYQNTDFQLFGVKGQSQKGIDILSSATKTAIQCKLKDNRKKDETIRKCLFEEIRLDISKFQLSEITVDRLIFASTYRDDALLQEFVMSLRQEIKLNCILYYWGWDTLSKYAEQYDEILKKYFPNLLPAKPRAIKPKIELPEGALGRDLFRKNYINYLIKRYGDWKQIELNKKEERFNWASWNKSIMNRYKASGINYIPFCCFDELVAYLKGRIDRTIMGRTRTAYGKRNYSDFEEHAKGVLDQ